MGALVSSGTLIVWCVYATKRRVSKELRHFARGESFVATHPGTDKATTQ